MKSTYQRQSRFRSRIMASNGQPNKSRSKAALLRNLVNPNNSVMSAGNNFNKNLIFNLSGMLPRTIFKVPPRLWEPHYHCLSFGLCDLPNRSSFLAIIQIKIQSSFGQALFRKLRQRRSYLAVSSMKEARCEQLFSPQEHVF